jgi:hypothetical protein
VWQSERKPYQEMRGKRDTGAMGPGDYLARAYGSKPSFARAADQLWLQRKIEPDQLPVS